MSRVIPVPLPESASRFPRVAAAGLVIATLFAIAAAFAIARYMPAVDDARALRADVASLASRAVQAGIDVDRQTLDQLTHDLSASRSRLDRLRSLLVSDPLVGLARAIPPTQGDVLGMDAVAAAAGSVLDAAEAGLLIAERFVALKETPGGGDTLPRLVELMAASQDDARAAQAAIVDARASLAAVPDGLTDVAAAVRDDMTAQLHTHGELLDTYVAIGDRLPAILGWDGPRRYLVLTQNPAEIRPTGGYIGSYGIVTFDRGRVTDRSFRDVALLDFPWEFPFVTPPPELTTYLLGAGQPWQLADANWSPDFPTSAADALRLYTNESGDDDIDGVLAVTTFTIDELLAVTGPVAVAEYDTTVASGETTLKALEQTRVGRPGENRKAFLSVFADELFNRLMDLPPTQWAALIGRADAFRDGRLIQAWFPDPEDQALVADGPFGGGVRRDPGDYVYPVDSNVAPASKINAIATRSLRLDVVLDEFGDARHDLGIAWTNPIETAAGLPYRSLPTLESMRMLGMYFRLLTPEGSTVESVAGGSLVDLAAPAVVGSEAGRSVFGSYLLIPPGSTELSYRWSTPRPVEQVPGGFSYRLVIQKQAGLRAGPLTLTIKVPAGFRIDSATPGLEIAGDSATLSTTFDRDMDVALLFSPTEGP